jgi:hypothetical protein
MPMKPKIRDGLVVSDFGDELVVCGPRPGGRSQVYHLNGPAALVFRLCDGTATTPELAAEIAEAFARPAEEVEPQVRSIVALFRQTYLLTWKPVPRRRVHQHEHHHGHHHEHHDEHHQEHQHEHHEQETDEPGDERRRIYRQVPASE